MEQDLQELGLRRHEMAYHPDSNGYWTAWYPEAQVLQCKRSEDGDGATGRKSIRLDSCRMHDSLYFAVGRPTDV